jgi:polyisoprenoid-binding protein YceI
VAAAQRFVLAPSGNEASFTVREQLMTLQAPSNAVGTTHAITGGITFLPSGKVDPAQSRITVDLSTLVTDKENRDRWIKSHTLRTDSFPNAMIAVRDLPGLPAILPSSGSFSLHLVGDLTIHGVTRPSTWDVTLTANGNDYTGSASTHIRFEDFGMEQPRLMIVVSVIDDVQLQYNFHFIRAAMH